MVNSITTLRRMSLVPSFLEKLELEGDDADTPINRGKTFSNLIASEKSKSK